MKKLIVSLGLCTTLFLSSCAALVKAPLTGFLYTGTQQPLEVTDNTLGTKVGEASAISILGWVAFGDASIQKAAKEGNSRAKLALDKFVYEVRKVIGAYTAAMQGVDAIVFTAGVGENDVYMRDIICTNLGNLGIKLDPIKNKVRGKETEISTEDSKVKLLLIPTNEELMIARDTYEIARKVK